MQYDNADLNYPHEIQVLCKYLQTIATNPFFMGTQIFQKSVIHLKILVAVDMTCKMFRTAGPQILGAIVRNSVARILRTPAVKFTMFSN